MEKLADGADPIEINRLVDFGSDGLETRQIDEDADRADQGKPQRERRGQDQVRLGQPADRHIREKTPQPKNWSMDTRGFSRLSGPAIY